MGLVILLKGFAGAVVGGGSLPGAILGGLIVGVFENLGAGYIDGNLKDAYVFILMIVVLTVKLSGLFGYEVEMNA